MGKYIWVGFLITLLVAIGIFVWLVVWLVKLSPTQIITYWGVVFTSHIFLYLLFRPYLSMTQKQALLESESLKSEILSAVMNNMQEGMAIHKVLFNENKEPVDYEYLQVNPSFYQHTGLSGDIVGKKASEINAFEKPPFLDIYIEVSQTGKPITFETYFEPLKKHFSISAFRIQGGHFATVFSDITERKTMETNIQASAEKYRTMAELTFDWETWTSPTGKFVFVSPACEEASGYTPEDFYTDQKLMENIVYPEDRDKLFHHIASFEETPCGEAEFRIQHKDGSIRWISHICRSIYDDDGKFLGRRARNRDITDIKKSNEAVEKIEGIYRRAITAAGGVPYHRGINPNRYFFVGEGITQLTGYPPEKFTPELWGELHIQTHFRGELEGLTAEDAVRKVREGIVSQWTVDYQIQTKDGDLKWVADTSVELRDEKGQSIGSIGFLLDISSRKETEEELRSSLSLLQAVIESSTDGLLVISHQGQVLNYNHQFESLWKLMVDDKFIEDPDYRIEVLESKVKQPGLFYRLNENPAFNNKVSGYELMELKDSRILERYISPYRVGDETTGQVWTFRDVTERRKSEEALRESEENFRSVFRAAPFPMLITRKEDSTIIIANQAATAMLGVSELYMDNLKMLNFYYNPTDRKALLEQMASNDNQVVGFEIRLCSTSGQVIWVDMSVITMRYRGDEVFVIGMADVTERKQTEHKLKIQALTDQLTGLPNRTLLLERIGRCLSQQKRHRDYQYAVLMMDLDRFKEVNDTLGHLEGDQLLVDVARKLEHIIRPTDTAARLGGDEFVLLLEDIHEESDAILVAERLKEELKQPIYLNDEPQTVTTSLGIVIGNDSYNKPFELIRDADIALYQAKQAGRDQYAIFTPKK